MVEAQEHESTTYLQCCYYRVYLASVALTQSTVLIISVKNYFEVSWEEQEDFFLLLKYHKC